MLNDGVEAEYPGGRAVEPIMIDKGVVGPGHPYCGGRREAQRGPRPAAEAGASAGY